MTTRESLYALFNGMTGKSIHVLPKDYAISAPWQQSRVQEFAYMDGAE